MWVPLTSGGKATDMRDLGDRLLLAVLPVPDRRWDSGAR